MTTMLDPAALDRLAAEAWDAMLELHPLFATTLGDRRFDRLVPPATPEEAAVGAARLRDLRARLDDLGDPAPGQDAITVSALRETLDAELAELEAGMLAWNVNPLDSVPTSYLDVPAYQPLATPADGEAMVARWMAMA